jgi:hypothetical protein
MQKAREGDGADPPYIKGRNANNTQAVGLVATIKFTVGRHKTNNRLVYNQSDADELALIVFPTWNWSHGRMKSSDIQEINNMYGKYGAIYHT